MPPDSASGGSRFGYKSVQQPRELVVQPFQIAAGGLSHLCRNADAAEKLVDLPTIPSRESHVHELLILETEDVGASSLIDTRPVI